MRTNIQFQNKRNRGNKSSANAKKSLRTASASLVQSATQLPIIDGRRVASLPSRKYVPAPQVRATRPLPRRDVPIQDVPLARTLSQESQESDGTNFSFSSIPSNGGFTGFSYPSIQHPTQMVQQPTYNLDPLITATYSQPIYPPVQQIYDPLIPQQVDQYNLYGDVTNYPQPTQMSELDFESYLNLNIDNLAPPTEDLGYDLEAQIQAALRPSTTQTETLAPTMSPSETSPYSDFSNSWFNEFDFGNLEGGGDDMELLKVVLDGMSNGSMEGSPIEKTELYPGLGVGGRSESPETVASFALNSEFSSQGGSGSGRQSPNVAGPSTSNSVVNSENENDLSFMFNFDLAVSQDVQGDVDYGQNAVAGGSGSGSGWIGGVLPYDMGDQVMGTA